MQQRAEWNGSHLFNQWKARSMLKNVLNKPDKIKRRLKIGTTRISR